MLRTMAVLLFLLLAGAGLCGPVAAATTTPAHLLTLEDALLRGLENNYQLRAERLNLPISRADITMETARFDPVADAGATVAAERQPTAAQGYDDGYARWRRYHAEVGLGKKFLTGLEARLALASERLGDSVTSGLDPEYRTYLVLDFVQPLLRNFGTAVNSSDLRSAEQRHQQSFFFYLDQAQRLAAEIELAYFELARSREILRLRIESRQLAETLLRGNQQKFDAGAVPISEVQEALTAVAARDEQVIFARQQMETAAHQLKGLIDISPADPLADATLLTEPLPATEQPWPPLAAALDIALAQRPDLDGQRREITRRDIRLAFYQNQTLPRLDLEASLGVNGLSGDLSDPNNSAARSNRGDYWRSVDSAASGDGYQWFAGVRFEYPLGNRAARSRQQQAGHAKRQALYQLKGLERRVETEVRNAFTTVERSYERVAVAERFQLLADQTLNQEMERLYEGLSDTFRILDFQDKVIEARIRRTNALADFNQGLTSLFRAMGDNLERRGMLPDPAGEDFVHSRY
ncbi:MAG: TolC family protein [Pelovirga sp.]